MQGFGPSYTKWLEILMKTFAFDKSESFILHYTPIYKDHTSSLERFRRWTINHQSKRISPELINTPKGETRVQREKGDNQIIYIWLA